MKYTELEVLDIIKSVTDKSPHKIFNAWINKKANTLLDLSKYKYPSFVYTFPIKIDDKEVGDITLVDLYHNTSGKDDLMLKYLGKEDYDRSWDCFSHDTYLFCYLTIRKEFKLSEICKGMYGDIFKGIDANGSTFEFQISYGDPEEEKDGHYYDKWVNNDSYRFDNGINVKVNRMDGWSLGEKINENIKSRLISYKK